MATGSFLVYIKTDDMYRDILQDLETKFDTSNHELESNSIDRSLAKQKNKKINWINERWIRQKKVIAKYVGLREKRIQLLNRCWQRR